MMSVAPPAGAWIETSVSVMPWGWCIASHPPRVRGLKPSRSRNDERVSPSHPPRVRGLKHWDERRVAPWHLSHPPRVRGLKPCRKRQEEPGLGRRTPRGCVD